ncbi:MAG: metal-dependent hydrolase [Chloroflexi bacterium]|nr:amidohydrolase [Chloroflexi bacterium CFX1]MCK6568647.1 amidohydrolase family protein [Anaerolineales bacterium]MCQ3954748.1 amidohydrolase [Chloroflexota bacterium]MDL1917866.1 amidohydrolase [Chloroflexi bacterium CFX5]RIK53117.1 MAG: metal-dependent hydrolase [Chloroflexota bacterium]
MIIDFHIHLSLPEHELPSVMEWMRGNFQGDLDAYLKQILTPQGIRRYLQENDIDLAVGLAEVSPVTTGVADNDYTGKFCAEINRIADPASGPRGRVLPFASINPYIVNDLPAELERLVEEYDFKGIKVYPPYQHHYVNDPRMYPLYAKVQELGLPMMVHTGSSVFKGARIKYGDPLLLDDVAIDFPNLNILMCHSGRPFWYEQAFWMARRHENVYMEVSGLPAKYLLDYFPRLEELAHKVIYGSDWPGNPDLKRNVEAIRALPISDEAKQKILHDNAARILKL